MIGTRRYRPQLELLESRTLLSTVTNLMDSGTGSLRQAIVDTPSGGTVDFQSGLSGTITLSTGELLINKDLTIGGPGESVITVSGNHLSRVFDIPVTFTEAISGLTIADGNVTDAYGGGISNGGTLIVTDSILSDNAASGTSGAGGGIFNSGTLTVTDTTLSANAAGGPLGVGGGIANIGTLTVTDSTLSANSSTGEGGGIYNNGMLIVTASTLSGNSSTGATTGAGGGIANYRTLTVTASTFTSNSAAAVGGGIMNRNMLTVTASTFSGNFITGTFGGGGIFSDNMLTVTDSTFRGDSAANGAGIYILSGRLTVMHSTFSTNCAANNGGGIWIGGGVTVTNCTFSSNSATNNGGGIYISATTANATIANCTFNLNAAANGAGITRLGSGTVTLTSSTLSRNIANNEAGGIFHSGTGSIVALNTILADNSAPTAPDVSGDLSSQGHNLIGIGDGGSGYDPTDLVGTSSNPIDPKLGSLQDNGGSTQTMALLAGSPALNAGDASELGNPDQRGVVRSGGVNIGAYQASASAFLLTAPDTVSSGVPFDVTVTAVDPFGQVAVGYTGTVTFSTSDIDPEIVLPADYIFTADDGGSHTFSDTGLGEVTLVTPGEQTLTVADTADDTINGTATISVMGGNVPWTHDRFWTDLAPSLLSADRRR
jgi:parallel beta-helix repeat protein